MDTPPPSLSSWFNQTKYTSFQRQLNLYGFTRIVSGKMRDIVSSPHGIACNPLTSLVLRFIQASTRTDITTRTFFAAKPFSFRALYAWESRVRAHIVPIPHGQSPTFTTSPTWTTRQRGRWAMAPRPRLEMNRPSHSHKLNWLCQYLEQSIYWRD
jgi:HSF-type DNA-binding